MNGVRAVISTASNRIGDSAAAAKASRSACATWAANGNRVLGAACLRPYSRGMLEASDGSKDLPWIRSRVNAALDDDVAVKPPKGYRLVRVVTDSSPVLEDLASFRRDLEMARQFAIAWKAFDLDPEDGSRPVETAFWVAAVTMYGRAFATGVRTAKVPLEGLTDEQLASHRFFIDLRNKYVAHAVNAYEGSIAFAYITDSAFAHPDVTRVGQVHIEATALNSEECDEFLALCELFISSLQSRIEALNYEIRGELLQMGPAAVYQLPDLELPTTLSRESVARRRASSTHRRPGTSKEGGQRGHG